MLRGLNKANCNQHFSAEFHKLDIERYAKDQLLDDMIRQIKNINLNKVCGCDGVHLLA